MRRVHSRPVGGLTDELAHTPVWAACLACVDSLSAVLVSQYSPKNHVIYSNRSMCYGRLGKYTVLTHLQ
jgi:hypothetical protein